MSYIAWIRRHVGRQKIFLVFATVVLRDDDGRLLLQRRTDFDWWGLPGGALELDEDIQTCARRELREETGLTAGPLRLVGVYTDPRYDVTYPNGDEVQQFTICLTGRANGGQMAADGVETTAQRFFRPEALPLDEMPIWYRAMALDALAGGPPRFLPPYVEPGTDGRLTDQIARLRPLVGQARFIGPGATAVVRRDDGRVLLVQRQDDGGWALPAGFCDLGENVAQTAVREVGEETGLLVEPERILGIYSSPRLHHTYPNGDQIKNVGVIFRARPTGGALRPQRGEVRRLVWLPPDEAGGWFVHSRYGPLFRRALAGLDDGVFID